MICRPGNHRAICSKVCRPQSVSFLCRRWCCRAYRSEGARAVRNGRPQTRPAQGICGSHHTKPAQSAGFDEVAVRGAYRIAVDATRLDLAPPSSLKSVIETAYDRAIGNKRADQELQQTAGDPSARPALAVQHPMIVGEARPLLQPHDTKCGGNGPRSGAEYSPSDQHEDVSPGRHGKAIVDRQKPA